MTTQIKESGGAVSWISGMAIDCDGAPRAYHKDSAQGLDRLANAGKPGDWWGLVTNTGKPDGQPIIQGASDPAPGFFVSDTALDNPKFERTDPRRYVDASLIKYISVPRDAHEAYGIKLGDVAMAIHLVPNACGPRCAAVVADIGPRGKYGEASPALAEAVSVNPDARDGGCTDGIQYIVFPGSGKGWPRTNEDIAAQAEQLYTVWLAAQQVT